MRVIPNTIFQTSIEKPEKYVIDKIIKSCPDWTYKHFNDEEIISFFNENYIEEFKDIVKKFNNMPTGAHKADLFRYYYLYLNGGVFLDSDAMLEVNIEDIVQDYDFFSVKAMFYNKNFKDGILFQGFLGCTPKNYIIYNALQNAYHIDVEKLRNSYHLLCYNLYYIVKKYMNTSMYKIKIYQEYKRDGYTETYNDKNESILTHYYLEKKIPI